VRVVSSGQVGTVAHQTLTEWGWLCDVVYDGTSARQQDALDAALAAYDAERRPAATEAIERNHQQALRIWPPNPHDDPWSLAEAFNPAKGWGARGAGWGQNPAALAEVGAASDAT
jgi:hypothetical protein